MENDADQMVCDICETPLDRDEYFRNNGLCEDCIINIDGGISE